MKIDRLIGILTVLLQKEKSTAAELAKKFEVSRRTINRDIEALCCAGIPLVTTKGQGGGIAIMEGYKIDKTLLSSSELQAILTGLQSLDSVSGTTRYRQLMEKLSADYPDTMHGENHILIDLSAWDKGAVSEKLECIQSAIESSESIAFDYYAPSGETHREIEPYHLIFQWSSWYVWGFCVMRNDYRMFKLTRMTGLVRTGKRCPPRDVPAYQCDKLLHTKGEITAKVKFDKSVKWRIIDQFGTELPEFDADGNILLTFRWSDVLSFYQYILTFGDQAELLEPAAYRSEFAALLKRIAEKYETEIDM